MRLYELSEEYNAVQELMDDPDVDPQTVMDTLEAIDGEIEDKADGYAKLITNLNLEAEMIKTEEERLSARRKSKENLAQSLKNRLQENLEFIGKTKFKTALFSFSVAQNGGKQPLAITGALDDIPGRYLIPQPPVPNKDAIRELLETKEVEWAHLEPRGKSLRIR